MLRSTVIFALAMLSGRYRNHLRNELIALGSRLLIGVILAIVAISSISQVGIAIQRLMEPLRYGLLIELTVFGAIAAVCIWGLIRGMRRLDATAVRFSDSDMQRVADEFLRGFFEGRKAHKKFHRSLR